MALTKVAIYYSYKRKLSGFLLLLLISPALALVQLFKSRSGKFIVVASTLLMGMFGALFAYSEGSDGQFHYDRAVRLYSDMGLGKFLAESWYILIQSPTIGVTDLYIHTLSFLSSSVLQMPKSLHFFAGLVLGYFIAKSLLLVMGKRLIYRQWHLGLAFLFVLLLIHSVPLLNAIRIGTGTWVLFYGTFGYFKTKKYKYLLFILFATQIHLAISVMAIPTFLAFLLWKRKLLILGIWIGSFLFQLTPINIKSYLPKTDVVEQKSKYYVLDNERMEELESNRSSLSGNWYATQGPFLYFNYALGILIISSLLLYLKRNDTYFTFLFSTAILYYSFANIVGFVPSLQGRLMNCVSIFLLFGVIYSYLYKYNSNGDFFQQLAKIGSIIFFILSIPYLLKGFSQILVSTEFFFLAFPLISFFLSEDLSFRDVIGDII